MWTSHLVPCIGCHCEKLFITVSAWRGEEPAGVCLTLTETHTRLPTEKSVWQIWKFATERKLDSGPGVTLLAGYRTFPRSLGQQKGS